ncbi:predicted protein [Histoplasma capsulatum H143]|uniref:Uncharacterized protein n=1 Tax=Ajellomyces capsulatus (strain H143) TaxID=544712 RepID=C6HAQ3_AJECH|nr:predicted protein [Histoplasma capsulatum H143]
MENGTFTPNVAGIQNCFSIPLYEKHNSTGTMVSIEEGDTNIVSWAQLDLCWNLQRNGTLVESYVKRSRMRIQGQSAGKDAGYSTSRVAAEQYMKGALNDSRP